MDYFEPPVNIEFLDLSDVEEQERNYILSSIHTTETRLQLPWMTAQQQNYNGYNQQPTQLAYSRPNLKCKESAARDIYQAPPTYSGQESITVINSSHIQPSTKTISTVESRNDTITPKPVQNGESGKARTWASLLKKTTPDETQQVCVEKPKVNDVKKEVVVQEDGPEKKLQEQLKEKYDGPHFVRMGEFLTAHVLDNRTISLQPRGLINRSNYCYINSILQALLACPPMYNLLNGLAKNVNDGKDVLPIINGLSRFVQKFHPLPSGQRVGRRSDKNQKKEQVVSINCDTPFEPAWMYKVLSGMRSDSFVVEGRQEDAEEFLGCLLDGLNDEMLDLIKLVSGTTVGVATPESSGDADKEWQVMGPKNKGSVTRRMEFNRTPVSNIFGGLLRSRLHKSGDHYTDNIQPFFTLQLNIENVTTVKEALDALVTKNQLEGVTSSTTNEEVEAWQQVTIEELPIVLILHLKCFDFKLDGCTKIIKALDFPIDLKIESKLLSSVTKSSPPSRQYKLFAVVYHDGKEATKGHYVTDTYHVGYASWLRYDDASVKGVQEEQVLKPQGTRVPYLLFYRRSDSIKSK